MNQPLEKKLPDKVIDAINRRHKIEAIKLLRKEWNIDLKEAKDYIDEYINGTLQLPPVRSRSSETGLDRFFVIIITLIILAAVYYNL
jgi:hypothetical protein